MDVLFSDTKFNKLKPNSMQNKQILSPIPRKKTHILKFGKLTPQFKSFSNFSNSTHIQPLERGLFEEFEIEAKRLYSVDQTRKHVQFFTTFKNYQKEPAKLGNLNTFLAETLEDEDTDDEDNQIDFEAINQLRKSGASNPHCRDAKFLIDNHSELKLTKAFSNIIQR